VPAFAVSERSCGASDDERERDHEPLQPSALSIWVNPDCDFDPFPIDECRDARYGAKPAGRVFDNQS
jgi:hypothetical protein